MPTSSFVTSIDIINLSHSLKDICEVDCKCKTPDCMNMALKTLMQYNLIKLNLIFSEQLDGISNRSNECEPGPAAPGTLRSEHSVREAGQKVQGKENSF